MQMDAEPAGRPAGAAAAAAAAHAGASTCLAAGCMLWRPAVQPAHHKQGRVHALHCAPIAILHAVAGGQAQAHAGGIAARIRGGQAP